MSNRRRTYIADFETTTDPDDCRVWLWGIVDIYNHDKFTYGNDIESFIEHCHTIKGDVYFHNLAFDGSSLLDYILKNGWTHVEQIRGHRQVETLISMQNKFYQIRVRFDRGVVTFKDSLKKLPMSVAAMASAFGYEMAKGDIDYDKPRPIGYEPTPEEIDYVYRDVLIPAQAIRTQIEQGLDKLTVGADALAQFQSSFRGFNAAYPILSTDVDADIRRAYRGGFTYVNPKYRNRIMADGGSSYDVNSLYPHIMYSRMLPYDWPEYFDGAPEATSEAPLWVATITVTAKLRKGGVPCIQLKNTPGYAPTEYLERITEPTDITVTNIDWNLIQDMYHVTVLAYGGGYRFKARNDTFRAYIDYWTHIKESSTGGLRTLAKLQLNSLYGKFATGIDVTGRVPVITDTGVLKLEIGPEEFRDPIYTPVGVFVTSWARDMIVRAAHALGDRFMYADTDSLHIRGTDTPADLEIHPTRMGAWKHEYNFTRARYVRAKCYAEELSDGTTLTRIAGLPERGRANITVDTLVPGATFQGKLKPKRVPGGIVLVPIDFTIEA